MILLLKTIKVHSATCPYTKYPGLLIFVTIGL